MYIEQADLIAERMDAERAERAAARDYALRTGDYDVPEDPVDEFCDQCGNDRDEGHEPKCPKARGRILW